MGEVVVERHVARSPQQFEPPFDALEIRQRCCRDPGCDARMLRRGDCRKCVLHVVVPTLGPSHLGGLARIGQQSKYRAIVLQQLRTPVGT